MQYCSKCNIQIRGTKTRCPLCQGQLSGEGVNPAFPVIPRKRSSRMSVLRVSLFLFIAFEVAMSIAGFVLQESAGGIILAMLAAVIAILDIALTLYYRSNPLHIVVWEIYIALGVVFLVDLFNGFKGWSVSWVFPAGFVGIMITTAAIGKGIGLLADDYIMYQFLHLILSLGIQILFLFLNWNRKPLPAVISIGFSIVFFAGMVIFNRHAFKGEAKKFFNV